MRSLVDKVSVHSFLSMTWNEIWQGGVWKWRGRAPQVIMRVAILHGFLNSVSFTRRESSSMLRWIFCIVLLRQREHMSMRRNLDDHIVDTFLDSLEDAGIFNLAAVEVEAEPEALGHFEEDLWGVRSTAEASNVEEDVEKTKVDDLDSDEHKTARTVSFMDALEESKQESMMHDGTDEWRAKTSVSAEGEDMKPVMGNPGPIRAY